MYETWRVGEFKTGRISLRSPKGENKTGRIQSCIQYLKIEMSERILYYIGYDIVI